MLWLLFDFQKLCGDWFSRERGDAAVAVSKRGDAIVKEEALVVVAAEPDFLDLHGAGANGVLSRESQRWESPASVPPALPTPPAAE